MMEPKVDIFIINYNGARFLESAFTSILSQDYAGCRFIFSDNGSTDQSVEIARRFESRGLEIRVRNPGTGGIFSHYNLCFQEAQAPFVGIFHNDDLYAPNIVRKQIQVFNQHPQLDAVLAAGSYLDGQGNELWPVRLPQPLLRPVLDPTQVIHHMMSHGNSFFLAPSALFRTEAMKRNGGFSLNCGNSGDVEMWMRILLQGGGIGFIDEPLFKYRITDTQISSKGEAARTTQSEYFEVMDRFVSQIKVSAEVQTAYEGLKQLDLLQAGLNLHQLKSDPELLLKSAKWFGDRQNQSALKNFGLIDRIKVRGVLALSPWLATGAGPWLSRKWSRLTDPRTSLGLKVLMKLKR